MNIRIWTSLVATGLFFACSSNDTAGSTFETENSVAKITVTGAENKPASHCKIKIRQQTFWANGSDNSAAALVGGKDSVESDENGNLHLDTLIPGDYLVEAITGTGESLRLGSAKFHLPESIKAPIHIPVYVDFPTHFQGTVQTEKFPVSVFLRGTDYTATIDSAGNFFFPQVPKGRFEFIAVYTENIIGKDSVILSSDFETFTLNDTATKAFLFEDFENGTSNWYSASSEFATASLESSNAGGNGLAAHFTCQNDSVSNWALMGRPFTKTMDLSSLDSVSFWAKGSVKNHISFSFDVLVDSTADFKNGKSWQHFEIDSIWTRYVITPQSLLSPDSIGGNIGWESVKNHVTNISIFGGAGGEFWIDDIVFYGITFE